MDRSDTEKKLGELTDKEPCQASSQPISPSQQAQEFSPSRPIGTVKSKWIPPKVERLGTVSENTLLTLGGPPGNP